MIFGFSSLITFPYICIYMCNTSIYAFVKRYTIHGYGDMQILQSVRMC